MKSRLCFQKLLSSCLLLFFAFSLSNAQNPINLKVGVGIPELIGLSAGLQIEQVEILFGAGAIPIPDDYLSSIYGDMYVHLFGADGKSSVRPWYARAGLCYFKEETERWIDRYTYLTLRFGRTTFLSKNLSLELDLGSAIELAYNREIIIPTTSWFNFGIPFVPAIGTRVVFQIGSSAN